MRSTQGQRKKHSKGDGRVITRVAILISKLTSKESLRNKESHDKEIIHPVVTKA